mgnify:CR=1 FL=1
MRGQDGDQLTLEDGLRVRLAEIEAPALSGGRGTSRSAPFGPEARAILAAAATGWRCRLYYGGLSRDRYGRAIAHVVAEDEAGGRWWLNGAMVRAGAARVRSWPDNARRVRRLYALEGEARAAGRGLWALADYRVRDSGDLAGAQGFVIVEGPRRSEGETAGGDARALIRQDGVRLLGLAQLGDADAPELGRRVRVRGWLGERAPDEERAGASIPLTHWGQIEPA